MTVLASEFLAALPEFATTLTETSPQLVFWLGKAHEQFDPAAWGSLYDQAVIYQTAIWLHAGAFGHRARGQGGTPETGYAQALRELAAQAPRATLTAAGSTNLSGELALRGFYTNVWPFPSWRY